MTWMHPHTYGVTCRH